MNRSPYCKQKVHVQDGAKKRPNPIPIDSAIAYCVQRVYICSTENVQDVDRIVYNNDA